MPDSSMPWPRQLARLSLIALGVAALAGSFAYVGGWLTPQRLSPQRVIDTFEANAGVYPGYRRAHSKGLCLAGYFESSGQAASLSRAPLFGKGRVPLEGRMSIGGSNPHATDTGGPVRSMALLFRQADGQEWRTAMNTPPVLPVATPEAFYQQMQAGAPDPVTGKPDPTKMQAFFAAHPESAAFLKWVKEYRPSTSFASTTYNSTNAFRLIGPTGTEQAVRWSMVPELEPVALNGPSDDVDALQHELLARLAQGPVRWHLMLTLAEPGDAVNDATQAWPASRRQVDAGSVVIEQAVDQLQGTCHATNFDPLILPVGIEPSADPILLARSAAYAESFKRRTREGAPQPAALAPAPATGAQP